MNELINEQREQIAQLTAERDALAAQVEALRGAAEDAAESLGFLSHHLRGRMGEAALMDMAEKADALNEALKATPQHHLRELQAEAVLNAVNFGRNQTKYFLRSSEDILQQIEQYADNIRNAKDGE